MAREDWIDPLDMTGLELQEFYKQWGYDYTECYISAKHGSNFVRAEWMEWALNNRAKLRLRGTTNFNPRR